MKERKHHKSTLARVEMIKKLTAEHYEEGNQARCYKAVWRNFIYPKYRICYRTYLSYLGLLPPQPSPSGLTLFDFIDDGF